MFTKSEVKGFILKYGKKVLFPDFTNKLTWFVAGLGGTILLTPVAFEQLVYNWLVDTINLNSGVPVTLAELQSSSADHWSGFGLILIALAHNIANKIIVHWSEISRSQKAEKFIEADIKVFERFLNDFPPESRSVRFLRDVDLGGGYHSDETAELELFSQTWSATNFEFHNKDIEELRASLFKKSREFLWKLANNSFDINGSNRYRCVPDQYVNDFNYPPEVDQSLKELNEMATELYEIHSELIRTARRNLGC